MGETTIIKLRFPIPREVVLNANQPLHHRVKATRTKTLREMGELLGTATCSLTLSKYTVDVFVYAPSKRRIDPPNLYPTVKPIIDGLTDANLWEDDDHTHMESVTFKYGGLSNMPEVFIIELIIEGEIE